MCAHWTVGIALSVAVAISAGSSMGQEPAAKRDPSSTVAPPGTEGAKYRARTPQRASDAVDFANGLLRQRKFDLAAEEFERILKSGATGSELLDARFGLANARLRQGRYPDALRAFEGFLKDAPGDSRALTARYRCGELSYLLGDLARARRELETYTAAANGHPGLEMAWTYLGDVHSGLNDPARAKAAYEKSISSHPKGRMADRSRFGLGRALSELGERDQALRLFQNLAQQGEPEWVDRAWLQIGLIRQSAGEFAGAAEALASLERAAPKSTLRSEARFVRAKCLLKLGRTQDAESLLRPLAADGDQPFASRAHSSWRRSTWTATTPTRPWRQSTTPSSGFPSHRKRQLYCFDRPRRSRNRTVVRRPRPAFSNWPSPPRKIRGPITLSSGLPS